MYFLVRLWVHKLVDVLKVSRMLYAGKKINKLDRQADELVDL